MNPYNTALLKLAKRAETYSQKHIVESFVDVGPLFTILSNPDNQILFGRRGTGKTHVLGYLETQIEQNGTMVVTLDMRSIGSTGGIYSDPNLSISERATRLLRDTLAAIHDKILEKTIQNSENFDLSTFGSALDNLIDCAASIVVDGSIEIDDEESSSSTNSGNSAIAAEGTLTGGKISVSVSTEAKLSSSEGHKIKRAGTERLRIQFGSVHRELSNILKKLPHTALWIILDEWSEVPLDLQPFLADLFKRTVLSVRGVTVKIAAIEQRCNFRIVDSFSGSIGIEIGADAAASVNLDEFLVFDNNPQLAKKFFRELLYKHVKAINENGVLIPGSTREFIDNIFTQISAFDEFVRSSEGVPRDAINIISIAAQRALNNPISVPDVRNAARTWYLRAKQQAISSKKLAQLLLNWIVDVVIQHRQARAFLFQSETRDDLIDFLYDARVLHLIRQGVSAQDTPGKRFNVYALDYGCYVDLINTSRAPKGLFEAETEEISGFIEVPQTDFRSIRRAILELNSFYNTQKI